MSKNSSDNEVVWSEHEVKSSRQEGIRRGIESICSVLRVGKTSLGTKGDEVDQLCLDKLKSLIGALEL